MKRKKKTTGKRFGYWLKTAGAVAKLLNVEKKEITDIFDSKTIPLALRKRLFFSKLGKEEHLMFLRDTEIFLIEK